MQLTEHFSLDELTFSRVAVSHHIANVPNATQVANLKRLCETLLEPASSRLGVPFHIDSGFRCGTLNLLVHGAFDSAHLDGRAADIVPIGLPLRQAYDRLRAGLKGFDQLILEPGWIHIGAATLQERPRGDLLLATAGQHPGTWVYERLSA